MSAESMTMTERGEIWVPYCPKCGGEAPEESRFCPDCGQDLTRPVTVPQTPRIPEQRVTHRPTGVAILGVLQVLGSFFLFLLGVLMLIIGFFAALTGPLTVLIVPSVFFKGIMAGGIGIIMIIVAFLSFIVAFGFWNGLGWSWTLGLILAALGIVMGLASLPSGLILILLDALVVYYLTRPHVKRFFGKAG